MYREEKNNDLVCSTVQYAGSSRNQNPTTAGRYSKTGTPASQPIFSELVSSEGHIIVSINRSRINSKFSSDISLYICAWSHFYKTGHRKPRETGSRLLGSLTGKASRSRWSIITLIHFPYRWRRVTITLSARSCFSWLRNGIPIEFRSHIQHSLALPGKMAWGLPLPVS